MKLTDDEIVILKMTLYEKIRNLDTSLEDIDDKETISSIVETKEIISSVHSKIVLKGDLLVWYASMIKSMDNFKGDK